MEWVANEVLNKKAAHDTADGEDISNSHDSVFRHIGHPDEVNKEAGFSHVGKCVERDGTVDKEYSDKR